MIYAVPLDMNRALVNVSFAAGELNLLFVIEDQDAVAQRPVRLDFKARISTFDRAEIATALLNNILQVRPRRIVVRHANVFHAGKIKYANRVML